MRAFFLSSSVLLLVACGAASSPAGPEGSPSCDDLQGSARDKVQAAITANASCSTDADCVTVAFAADCFDSCTRAMNTQGAGAVDAAKASVNGEQCKTFASQSCKNVIPPCAPPMPPKCVSGACQ